jgi:hypothetical protein
MPSAGETMFSELVIHLSNGLTRLRRPRCRPEEVLLLLPHCLQRQDCGLNLAADVLNCKRCGRCGIAAVIRLHEKYGIRLAIASGGRQAAALVRRPENRLILAVACPKELAMGILATFPKPVYAVRNIIGNAPCVNTGVDCAGIETAIRRFVIL